MRECSTVFYIIIGLTAAFSPIENEKYNIYTPKPLPVHIFRLPSFSFDLSHTHLAMRFGKCNNSACTFSCSLYFERPEQDTGIPPHGRVCVCACYALQHVVEEV
jgi:hypothetical protein